MKEIEDGLKINEDACCRPDRFVAMAFGTNLPPFFYWVCV